MRVGQNPAKSMQDVPQPEKITVAVVVYIPFLSGYYEHSLDVLKLCLDSLRDNADLPFDLMVFDNASCAEVRDYLAGEQAAGLLQTLVLSEKNIGKAGAWNHLFGAAPGEFIVYADSDVYFYPGWLSPQIKTLEALPQAGMVTGMPMLTPEEFSTSTVKWAEENKDIQLERGQLLPWEDFWRHAGSIGSPEEKARQFYADNEAIRLTQAGQSYYIGASHFQFAARKAVLQEVLPIPSKRPMGQVRLLDIAINDKGYLRLCTGQWHVQHIGNTLPDKAFFAGKAPAPAKQSKARRSFWRLGPFRKLAQFLYDRSFAYLYKD
jgi:glycosyltransferase involved in cell wall biosynthesis